MFVSLVALLVAPAYAGGDDSFKPESHQYSEQQRLDHMMSIERRLLALEKARKVKSTAVATAKADGMSTAEMERELEVQAKLIEALRKELETLKQELESIKGQPKGAPGKDYSPAIEALAERLDELERREDRVGDGLSKAEVDRRVQDALESIEHPEGVFTSPPGLAVGAGIDLSLVGSIPGASGFGVVTPVLSLGLVFEDDNGGFAAIAHVGYAPGKMPSATGGGGAAIYKYAGSFKYGLAAEYNYTAFDVRDGGIAANQHALVPELYLGIGPIYAKLGPAIGLYSIPGFSGWSVGLDATIGAEWTF